MRIRSFRLTSFAVSALLVGIFSTNHYAQNTTAEKNGAVAGYVRELDEETGLVRKRTVERKTVDTENKFSAEQLIEFEKQAFALVNQKRSENGLAPIDWSDEVAALARVHSENMVKFSFFSHRGTDGKMVDGRADAVGLTRWTLIGENIAYNRGYQNPVETAVEKWMLSPTHRENILNGRWKESAIGIAVTNDGTFYFTQVFLRRK